MRTKLTLAATLLLCVSVHAGEVRNPYQAVVPIIPPLPQAITGPQYSGVIPPVIKISFDFAKKFVVVGLRGDSVMLRQVEGNQSTLHVLKNGQKWYFDGNDFVVRIDAGTTTQVSFLQDGKVVSVVSSRESTDPVQQGQQQGQGAPR